METHAAGRGKEREGAPTIRNDGELQIKEKQPGEEGQGRIPKQKEKNAQRNSLPAGHFSSTGKC